MCASDRARPRHRESGLLTSRPLPFGLRETEIDEALGVEMPSEVGDGWICKRLPQFGTQELVQRRKVAVLVRHQFTWCDVGI